MSLWKRIYAAAVEDPTGDPNAIALTLISRAKREEFLGLLADEIRSVQRQLTAHAERAAFLDNFNNGTTVEREARSVAILEKLKGREFILGRGMATVEHLHATSAEHRIRAAYLRKLAAGLEASAHRHDVWADQIDAAGVTCLAELADDEGAAA